LKSAAPPKGPQQLYAAGRLTGCFGIKGLLKLQSVDRNHERFSELRFVYLGPSADRTAAYDIESVGMKGKGLVVKFAAVDDRTAAEKLVGQILFVDEEQRVRPERGSYFVDDVIGCEVVGTDGKRIGVIHEVYQLSGHDLWEVQSGATKAMIPAVKEFIKNVDLGRRTITVELPEGLIDGGEAAGLEPAGGEGNPGE
jgi:16S rRNA processing protein RimM